MFTFDRPPTYPTFTFIYNLATTYPPLSVNVNCEQPLRSADNFIRHAKWKTIHVTLWKFISDIFLGSLVWGWIHEIFGFISIFLFQSTFSKFIAFFQGLNSENLGELTQIILSSSLFGWGCLAAVCFEFNYFKDSIEDRQKKSKIIQISVGWV